MDYQSCSLCPRNCHADRRQTTGFCKSSNRVKAARAALHQWEEPCISGIHGSGTVFFSGCNLRCCFCQNHSISSQGFGKELTEKQLSQVFLRLQDKGAHNINLVTGSHYIPSIIKALDMVKHRLTIPVVFNCGGYESIRSIQMLDGYVDIFLPDLKYFSSDISARYSQAPDYFEKASQAVMQMIRQTGNLKFFQFSETTSEGISSCQLMKKGVIIRHMVLPGCSSDSIKLLRWMDENLPKNQFLISLLSQFTPFYQCHSYPEINRRITTYEYEKVLNEAISLGLTDGFMQKKSSAKEEYTPPFDLEGLDF